MFQQRIEFTNKFWCSSNETYLSIGKPVYKLAKSLVVSCNRNQKQQTNTKTSGDWVLARAPWVSPMQNNRNAVMCAQCLQNGSRWVYQAAKEPRYKKTKTTTNRSQIEITRWEKIGFSSGKPTKEVSFLKMWFLCVCETYFCCFLSPKSTHSNCLCSFKHCTSYCSCDLNVIFFRVKPHENVSFFGHANFFLE